MKNRTIITITIALLSVLPLYLIIALFKSYPFVYPEFGAVFVISLLGILVLSAPFISASILTALFFNNIKSSAFYLMAGSLNFILAIVFIVVVLAPGPESMFPIIIIFIFEIIPSLLLAVVGFRSYRELKKDKSNSIK